MSGRFCHEERDEERAAGVDLDRTWVLIDDGEAQVRIGRDGDPVLVENHDYSSDACKDAYRRLSARERWHK